MSQWELLVKTSKLLKAHENANDRVPIVVSFASDWLSLRMTQVFGTNHRAKLSKPKVISDYPRHSNENYSNIIIVWVPRLCLRLCLRLGHFDSHNAVHTDFSTQIRWSPHRWLAVWVVGDGLTLLEFCVITTVRPRISGRSIVSIRRNIVNPALTTSILKRNSIIFKRIRNWSIY